MPDDPLVSANTQPLSAAEQQNLKPAIETSPPTFQGTPKDDEGNVMPGWMYEPESGSYVYVGGNYIDPATKASAAESIAVSRVVQTTLSNPLDDYDSYTYCLSWHLISINSYNNLLLNDDPYKTYRPDNVLVSSAGRRGESFARNPSFNEDFYFENLKMKTYVNTTLRNRNSNLIECDFTLIEPVGFTLINRLLEATSTLNPGGNYTQMPYVLQIDFFGYKDGNLEPIRDLTKIIPIRLTTFKSKVSSRGTEYHISAVPYNHQAFSQINIVAPASYSVTGSTVAEIFGKGGQDAEYNTLLIEKNKLQREQRAVNEFLAAGNMEGRQQAQQSINDINSKLKSLEQVSVTGFCNAINTWYKNLVVQKTIKYPNTINVVFDSEIGSAKLFPSNAPINSSQSVASGTSTQDKKTEIQTAGGSNKGGMNFNGTTMTIPAGTAIDKLIDWTVRNSDYIGKQLSSDPAKLSKIQAGANPFGEPLNWYRIVPQIAIKDYDKNQNRYSMDITFKVVTYKLSAKYPYAAKGRVPGYVKKYDYIYTGKNKSVIDLQIDFNMMYYLELSAYQPKQRINETGSALGTNNNDLNPDFQQPDSKLPVLTPDNTKDGVLVNPVTTGIVSGSTSTSTRTGGNPELAVAAGDLHRSIMLDARGDMFNVNMRIIGDPHLIKQDDVFYNTKNPSITGQLTPNQSLWMDGGELYIFINFQTPTDYDETTGLANPTIGRYKTSEFSGVYKIITIDNVFSNGKFEQVMHVAKLPYDQNGKPLLVGQTQRIETQTVTQLAPVVPNAIKRFTGPSINVASLNPITNAQAALNKTAGTVAGAATGLIGSVVNAGINAITNRVSSAIGGVVTKGIDALGKEISSVKYDILGPSTKDLAMADQADAYYNGTGTTEYGSFEQGYDPVPAESLETFVDVAVNVSTDIVDQGFAGGDYFS